MGIRRCEFVSSQGHSRGIRRARYHTSFPRTPFARSFGVVCKRAARHTKTMEKAIADFDVAQLTRRAGKAVAKCAPVGCQVHHHPVTAGGPLAGMATFSADTASPPRPSRTPVG